MWERIESLFNVFFEMARFFENWSKKRVVNPHFLAIFNHFQNESKSTKIRQKEHFTNKNRQKTLLRDFFFAKTIK